MILHWKYFSTSLKSTYLKLAYHVQSWDMQEPMALNMAWDILILPESEYANEN